MSWQELAATDRCEPVVTVDVLKICYSDFNFFFQSFLWHNMQDNKDRWKQERQVIKKGGNQYSAIFSVKRERRLRPYLKWLLFARF